MKPTKKKAVVRGSIEHKLLQLYNRIDEAWYGEEHKADKTYVWTVVEDIQNKKFDKLCKEDFEKCNGLWRQYA